MTAEQRTCQNCSQVFTIEPDDFGFYEKIRVPPPTFCPECRLQRRLARRNERALYKGKCKNCGKEMFSIYHPDISTSLIVFCRECWWSDAWDPLEYGREYDFSRPFFEQWQELFRQVPRPNLFQINPLNSPYANHLFEAKEAYLSYSIVQSEEVFYSKAVDRSRQMFDCFAMNNSERCFASMFGEKNYDVLDSMYVHSCLNSAYLFDCTNADNCFMSANLRNKQYVFRNEQCSKEEYSKRLAGIDTGSHAATLELKKEFAAMRLRYPRKYADVFKSVATTGDAVSNAKNSHHAFEAYELENVRHAGRVHFFKDSMDVNYTGAKGSELIYEYISGGSSDRSVICSMDGLGGMSSFHYCNLCGSSSDLFGCIGLRGKKHCILNRQYSPEEYKELLSKIMRHMQDMPYADKKGRTYGFGEFFPVELSPFAYNETLAQERFPLTKETAAEMGFSWRDPEAKQPDIDVAAADLPDHIKEAADDILQKTVGCAHQGECAHQCTTAFRIIPRELELYRRRNLPLPRLCPNCRYYERLNFANPWKLWPRQCHCTGQGSENGIYTNTVPHSHGGEHCPNEFETPYAPERPEIVYCEACYNAEIA